MWSSVMRERPQIIYMLQIFALFFIFLLKKTKQTKNNSDETEMHESVNITTWVMVHVRVDFHG